MSVVMKLENESLNVFESKTEILRSIFISSHALGIASGIAQNVWNISENFSVFKGYLILYHNIKCGNH